MRKLILVFLAVFFVLASGFSQSAEKISEILECGEISKGQASYFVCVYKNFGGESLSEADSFSLLAEKGLFKAGEDAEERISLSKACFLIAESAQMKGGIFYSIFHSPRYALREFYALGIVPQSAAPGQKVSGSEFIALLNEFEKKGKTK